MKTKTDLIKLVHRRTGYTLKECQEIVDGFLDSVKETIANEESLKIQDFAIFEVAYYEERLRRNPITGDIEMFPPSKNVRCRLSKSVKDLVKKE